MQRRYKQYFIIIITEYPQKIKHISPCMLCMKLYYCIRFRDIDKMTMTMTTLLLNTNSAYK